MSYEYRTRITVSTKMAGNGEAYKKSFNGTCSVGVNKRTKSSIAQKAEAYMQAVSQSQSHIVPKNVKTQKKSELPRLESVSRVVAIPIVESGINVTERIYATIKDSNFLFRWYLTLGEKSFATGIRLATPAVLLLSTPIAQLDWLLCKSLDVVEKRAPSIYMPPGKMYSETRKFVVRRASSVKQLGEAVLESRVSVATASALDRALTTADKYVDKYLPPDHRDAADLTDTDGAGVDETDGESGRARAAHAAQHGARLRRKLQRRLTRQALAEAKAIKEQIHVLVYVAELVATDPVLAWKKAKELYASLSLPEPENQARPATLEEVMVLLARETARKVVHLINYTHTDLPRNMRQGLSMVVGKLAAAADGILKMVPLDAAVTEARAWRDRLHALLNRLQATTRLYLENLALFLAGNPKREKITARNPYEQRDNAVAINGVN